MRKLIWVASCLIFMIFHFENCAISSAGNVEGNTFELKFSGLKISIDPEFKYLGKTTLDQKRSGVGVSSDKEAFVEAEWHVFIPRNASAKLDRIVDIYIEKVLGNSYFVSPTDNKKYLDFGDINLFGSSFQFYSQVFKQKKDFHLYKYLKENGYVMPDCLTSRTFISQPFPNTLLYISLIEDANISNMYCGQTYAREDLTNSQQASIYELHKRALAALGIGSPVKAVKEKNVEPISKGSQPAEKSAIKPNWSEAKEKIKALGELLEKGLITQEEYDNKKRQLLEQF